MSERLIYVAGPSGAGKDSVLGWLREQLPADAPVHWARRCITRPAVAGGEAHEALSQGRFIEALQSGAFALDWNANGLRYGIRHTELAPLARGQWVVVNGSRAYLPEALRRFPGLRTVHITARPETLQARLLARGRETPEQVQLRIARSASFSLPPGGVEIHNDGALEEAGRVLLESLRAWPGWEG